jgi:hypothetical protein
MFLHKVHRYENIAKPPPFDAYELLIWQKMVHQAAQNHEDKCISPQWCHENQNELRIVEALRRRRQDGQAAKYVCHSLPGATHDDNPAERRPEFDSLENVK